MGRWILVPAIYSPLGTGPGFALGQVISINLNVVNSSTVSTDVRLTVDVWEGEGWPVGGAHDHIVTLGPITLSVPIGGSVPFEFAHTVQAGPNWPVPRRDIHAKLEYKNTDGNWVTYRDDYSWEDIFHVETAYDFQVGTPVAESA